MSNTLSFKPNQIAPSTTPSISQENSINNEYTSNLINILSKPSAMERLQRDYAVNMTEIPYTPTCTKSGRECQDKKLGKCNKIHFDAVIASNTDTLLGDCSYLNTCFKGKNCRYVHYHISLPEKNNGEISSESHTTTSATTKNTSSIKKYNSYFIPGETLRKPQVFNVNFILFFFF